MPLLTPSDPAPSSLQNHSLPPDFAARCGEQLVRGHVYGCTRVPLSSQPPGPFSSPRAWPAHLSVAGEGTPPSSAGLCLVSTELWLEDSASQTLTVHPEGPDCIASHNKNSGTSLCFILPGGSQQAHSVVQRALSFILKNHSAYPRLGEPLALFAVPSTLPWPRPAPPGADGPPGS